MDGDVFGFFGSFVSDDGVTAPEVVDIGVVFIAAVVVLIIGFGCMAHVIHFLWVVTRRWS